MVGLMVALMVSLTAEKLAASKVEHLVAVRAA